MNRLIKISALLLMLLILGAPSCNDEQENTSKEESILSEAKNDIKEKFETDYLTETSLFGFENAAKQKLSDLSDYLNILTDTTLDKSFRQKAAEKIKDSFQSGKVKINLNSSSQENAGEIEVNQLIKQGLDNQSIVGNFQFDSIHVKEPLHRLGNSTYTGRLTFVQNVDQLPDSLLKNKSANKTADIYVIKELKAFGTDTLKIWTVRLGEIY
jgi:hypothetical protein